MKLAETLKLKHRFISQLRSWFDAQAFIEIQTPLLVKNPGLEPFLHYFETEFVPQMGGGNRTKLYLPTSPEYHLKKALALGLDKVFEITKSFRNGEKSKLHEPEFLMLEWYRHPGTYKDIAEDFFQLCKTLAKNFSAEFQLWNKKTDLSVEEAFERFASLDLKKLSESAEYEERFHFEMVSKIEPALKNVEGLVYLWDYPSTFAALSQKKEQDPFYAERFEVYFKGIELANAFGELTDPAEQRSRCLEDIAKRQELYGVSPDLDEEFLGALGKLKLGAGGIAVGLERLFQTMIGKESLQEVIAFPHWEKL